MENRRKQGEQESKASEKGKSETLRYFVSMLRDGSFREFLSDWKWIFSYSKKYRLRVLIFTVMGLLSSTLGLISAYLSKIMINIIVEKQRENLWLLITLFLLSTVMTILFTSISGRIDKKISIYVNNDIQKDIFSKLLDADWLSMSRYANGDLVNRFSSDVNTVATNAINWLPKLIINLYTFVLTFVMLFRLDPTMAWIAVISAPVLIFLSRFLLKRMREYQKRVLEMNSKMMSFEVETFYHLDMIKSFGIAHHSEESLGRWQNDYRDLNLDYNKFEIKARIMTSLLSTAVTAVAFGYSLYRLWTGQILYGDMTFFLSQRSTLTARFKALVQTVPGMIGSALSAHRIKELVDLPREQHNPISCAELLQTYREGLSIRMDGVSFAYQEGAPVYEHGNFKAEPGEIIALLGPSGEGKTTMIRLLLGLIHPTEGKVTIVDHTGKEIDMNADLRSFFSYVPQGNTLFSGTVAQNLRMIRPEATDDEIVQALTLACAWEFVGLLPEGIHAHIGEKGKGLSEGQAQRIAIARAILGNAPIMLLDEATSALDEETESRVLKNLIQKRPDKTYIVSTHRKSVLKLCNRIYMIKNRQTEVYFSADSLTDTLESEEGACAPDVVSDRGDTPNETIDPIARATGDLSES